MKELKEELKYFLNNKVLIATLIIVTLLSYGFAITHMSIGVDDLCFDRYVDGTYILSANRWGTWLIYKILGINEYNPFFVEGLTALIYMGTALLMCASIRSVAKDKISNAGYVVMACMFASFPVLQFPFRYQVTSISVSLGNALLILIVALTYHRFVNAKKPRKILPILLSFIVYGFIGGLAISTYESCIQTYIFFTCAMLLTHIRYVDKDIKFIKVVGLGLIFVLVLLICLAFYAGIGNLVINHLKEEQTYTGNYAYHQMNQLNEKGIAKLKSKVKSMIFYNPEEIFLTTFTCINIVFVFVAFAESIKNKSGKYLLLALVGGLANAIFFCMLYTLYYRTEFSWAVTVGFESMYIFEFFRNINPAKTEKLLIFIFVVLVFVGMRETAEYGYEDFRNNEHSKDVVQLIGNTIIRECENYKEKPVVYLTKQLFSDTDLLIWGFTAFEQKGLELTKYFNYLGYDIQGVDRGLYYVVDAFKDDYENSVKLNNYVSEGEQYIYVQLDNDL